MKGLSGEDQSLAHGGMTFAEAAARSEQSLQELLSAAMDVSGSDVSIEDYAWLRSHPNSTQADIDAHVAATFESGQRRPNDGAF